MVNIARAKTTGGAAPRVNVATIKAYPVPVPPPDEQTRIVSKANELMALCDQLGASLQASDLARSRLLDSVLATLSLVH